MKITCRVIKLSDGRGGITFSKESYADFQKALDFEGNTYLDFEVFDKFAKVTKV